MAQGVVLSLINSGVSSAVSQISDVISGEAAGFGVLSRAFTTFTFACVDSEILNIHKYIVKETVNNIIGLGLESGVYYGVVMEAVDSVRDDTGYGE